MAAVSLAPLAPADLDAIASLWLASARAAGQPGVETVTSAINRWRLENEGWELTVAWRGGARAGFLAVQPADRWLRQIFVAPDLLGSGVGTVLLAAAKQRMPGGFFLHTDLDNARARRFYASRGLVPAEAFVSAEGGHRRIRYDWAGD